jgi:hypothetical protein
MQSAVQRWRIMVWTVVWPNRAAISLTLVANARDLVWSASARRSHDAAQRPEEFPHASETTYAIGGVTRTREGQLKVALVSTPF